ncbi:testis-expressed protein 2-like isoform X2 [Anguilla anguilla]|uniref:testis-expressed protein 2-like isoform X2 n=1 Tax=Anguilla anguilla TaxID=7936 RepID=UPI0015AC34A7|nr:testis-expressed protein 2-like isoform X2 [Anguilla anguilla]
MTSQSGGHAERPGAPPSRPPAAPKLQVQRSLSRETITIHFSALGKEEEEEEEELYGAAISAISASSAAGRDYDDQGIVTALEASEDLLFEGGGADPAAGGGAPSADVAVLPVSSTTLPSIPQRSGHSAPSPALSILSSLHSTGGSAPASSSWPSGQKAQAQAPPPAASSSGSSPSKSVALPSGDKPFMSLVKSLSTDVEPREGVAVPPSVRHRHLMKTLVKSLSTDTSRQDQEAAAGRPPDSRLNLQLFKQFTQPRVTGAGDSKTAPSSPLTSPDNRSFFKVSEVEARIEDTKRRLSEVIYEPLQLLSKIMGEESGGAAAAAAAAGGGPPRAKALSSSASELCSLAALNGHLESNNNNYSIKEEECDSEGEGLPGSSASAAAAESPPAPPAPPLAEAWSPRHASLALEKCSMSALARQEDEEFCELYSEDFGEADAETDASGGGVARDAAGGASLPPSGSTGVGSEDETEAEEEEDEEPGSSVPHKTLCALTMLVYGYLVLPLPTYLGGVLLGVAVGFMLAIGVVWLAAPRCSGYASRRGRRRDRLWNVAHLDIKEPGMFKGWMNEILNYDPETYHATLTHSVFVRLDGSTLRLSKPGRNVARRATFNEPKPDVTYVSQKIYDLTDSKIYLVPESLARKRVWNKKYPICIELGKQEDFMSKAQADKPEAIEEKATGGGGERPEAPGGAEEAKRPAAAAQDGGRGPAPRDHTLFLFGRTGREKEEWFRRMLVASRLKSETKRASSLPGSMSAVLPTHSRSSSRGSLDEALPMTQPRQKELAGGVKQKMLLDYSVYMAKYVPPAPRSPAASPAHSAASSPGAGKKLPSSPGVEEESVAWVNALVGRIFWDFLGEKYWADMVSKKIQMKLSKIRLPYFMNELTLTELDMGVAIPKILQASKPSVDHQGLWFDLEISYNGSFLMTLETKMNLARLGKEGEGLRLGEPGKDGPRTYCLADSDEESSSAGSSDEEDPPDVAPDKNILPGAEGYVGGHKPSKIMRFVDKITKSKYFQKATETEFIKKKMEEVSNTPLLLTVEVQECQGTLAVNIPPPPTDRIWYGFRSPPHLELKARPKLGEREVTLAHVTDWIEKKLDQEFQKIFVMPNMDDVWLHIMHSAMDPRSDLGSAPVAPVAPEVTKDSDPSEPEGPSTGGI